MKRARQLNTPLSVKILDWAGRSTVPIRHADNRACRFRFGPMDCEGSTLARTGSLVPRMRVLVSVWQVGAFEVGLGKSGQR